MTSTSSVASVAPATSGHVRAPRWLMGCATLILGLTAWLGTADAAPPKSAGAKAEVTAAKAKDKRPKAQKSAARKSDKRAHARGKAHGKSDKRGPAAGAALANAPHAGKPRPADPTIVALHHPAGEPAAKAAGEPVKLAAHPLPGSSGRSDDDGDAEPTAPKAQPAAEPTPARSAPVEPVAAPTTETHAAAQAAEPKPAHGAAPKGHEAPKHPAAKKKAAPVGGAHAKAEVAKPKAAAKGKPAKKARDRKPAAKKSAAAKVQSTDGGSGSDFEPLPGGGPAVASPAR
ncbi:MAG: hypothetical protein IT373_29885 [Polyangiaceae bacterium]|nr:hypothetical protein [Polyangiaceae bacterium]